MRPDLCRRCSSYIDDLGHCLSCKRPPEACICPTFARLAIEPDALHDGRLPIWREGP